METTDTNYLHDDKIRRFIAADRAILLSMEDDEIEAIVYVIELALTKIKEENAKMNYKSDDLIERIEETLAKVKVRDELSRVDKKHCIYYLKHNMINPLEDLKEDIINDKKTLIILKERIGFYRIIVHKLMEKPVIV